jgi:3-methyladenine DNA glycosylase/8-oxoguanine DNA glycosylase
VIAILSQQVSLESANATFTKLENAIGAVNPEKFLTLDDRTLRAVAARILWHHYLNQRGRPSSV